MFNRVVVLQLCHAYGVGGGRRACMKWFSQSWLVGASKASAKSAFAILFGPLVHFMNPRQGWECAS